ncbi:MAG TPA: sialidase family protein [Solirubrobacteraceae bacterium]|nr:sialidase family protein [Solirubrobacteraceae bacterium]
MTANDLRAPRAQNSALLAVDPTDARFMVAATRLDAPDFGCGLEISGDRGRSWVGARPVPKLPAGAEKCYAPEIAFDREGTLYYLFVALSGLGNNPSGVYLTTSDDRARTFSSPRRVLGAGNYMVRMALDPTLGERGRMHIVWLKTTLDAPTGGLPPPPNPIQASFSDDGGASFSRPVQVSDPQRPRAVAPALALGPDHAVHILYYDLGDDAIDYQGLSGPPWPGSWSLVSTSSYDGGRHFGPSVVVDDRLKPPGRVMLIYTMPPPAIAAGGSRRLYAAWHDARNRDWDVFLSRSSDSGRTWSAPLRLNDDRRANGRHQYLPRLAVAPNGRVDAVFLDRRNDPRNVRNETFLTYARDGRSFAPNVRVSSARSDSRSGQTYLVPSANRLVEFGARLGLFSDSSRAIAAWTDTRNASAGAYQDIFAAEVAFSPTRRSSTPGASGRSASDGSSVGIVVAALLAAGAVGIAALSARRLRRPGRRGAPQ